MLSLIFTALLWAMAFGFAVFLLLFGPSMLDYLRYDDLGNARDNMLFADWWEGFRIRYADQILSVLFFLLLFGFTYFFLWCC